MASTTGYSYNNSSSSPETMDSLAEELNREYFTYITPALVVYSILSVFGVIGNSFVLYGYAWRYPRCNFKYFVATLASINLASCLTTIPGEVYFQYRWFISFDVTLCKTKSLCNAFTVIGSAYVLMMIAVDRFQKVCRPHGKQLSPVITLRLCIICAVVSLLWSSVGYVFCGPQRYAFYHRGQSINVTVCVKDDAYKDTIWPFLVMNVFYVLPNIIVMLATAVLYGIIAGVMSGRAIKSEKMEKRNQTPPPTIKITAIETEPEVDEPEEVSASGVDFSFVDSEFPVKQYSQGKNTQGKSIGRTSSLNGVKDRRTAMKFRSRKRMEQSLRPYRRRAEGRVRQKTLIMFILTLVYAVTTGVYLVIASQLSNENTPLTELSVKGEAILMSFNRIYFINTVISPVLYGFLDARFRRTLQNTRRIVSGSVTSRFTGT